MSSSRGPQQFINLYWPILTMHFPCIPTNFLGRWGLRSPLRIGTLHIYSPINPLSPVTHRRKITSCLDDIAILWLFIGSSQPLRYMLALSVRERNRSTHLGECDCMSPFWSHIFQVYAEGCDKPLIPSPSIALLSILLGAVKSQKNSLLRFFLSAARQLISRH